MRAIAPRYIASFRRFDRPWRELERCTDLEIETFVVGAIYLASGGLRYGSAEGR